MFSLNALFGDESDLLYTRDFQLLLLANVLAPLGIALISPILDSLIVPFAASPASIGLMVSFFTAPAIIIIPLAGLIADRVGRKPVLVGGLVLFSVSGAAVALSSDFRMALGLRLVQGIAFGGITPIIIASIGDLYGGARESTAQGIRFTGSGVSATLFPLISGFLVVLSWQFPFLLYALGIPIAIVVYRFLEEPTADARDDSGATDGTDTRQQLRDVFELVRQRRVLAIVVARTLPTVIWIAMLTYSSIIVVRLQGGTPGQAGLLVAIASFCWTAAASQAGRVTAIFDSRLYPLIGSNVALGVGSVFFLFAPHLTVAAVGVAAIGSGFGLALALYRSIITGFATESLRGSLVSVAEALGRVIATLTPVLMGSIIAVATPLIGFPSAVQLAGLSAAFAGSVGGIACLLVGKSSPPIRHYD